MRICLMSREFPPDTGWGGIGTFVHDLALGLAEIGEEVEVIALAKGDRDETIDYKGVPVHRVTVDDSLDRHQMLLSVMPYSHSVIKALFSMHRKFLELHEQKPFDVVEVPEMFGEGVFLALSKQAPLVVRLYTPHFKFIDTKLHLIDDSFDHQFLAIIEKLTLLSADIVSSPSSDLGDYVSEAVGFNTEEMAVIRGLIDTDRFCPDGPKALTGGHLKVVFVGRLEERKGVYQLVNAIPQVVKAMPDCRFYFLGNDTNTAPGKKSVLGELQKIATRHGVEDNIVFTGPVPHAKMPEYFRSADIFVLPSLYDNAPLTCLEAISSGAAMIGTSAGGMKEYVVHGESGLIVPPDNVQALSGALIDLLADSEKRQSFGRQARKRALELFDRRITAKKSVELYELARSNYQARSRYALYRKDNRELLGKIDHTLTQFDQMIYRLMYKRSLAFRTSYWFHMLKDRPKLFCANAVVGLGNLISRALGRDHLPASIGELEKRISALAENDDRIPETEPNPN